MPFAESPERLNVSMVKSQSRRLVFSHIFRHSPVTRAEIAQQTGLSQGTVKTVVDEFMEGEILSETKDRSAQVGRKPHKVVLRREARTFGALYIQPDRVEMHLLDLTLQPIRLRDQYPVRKRSRLADMLKDVLSRYTGDIGDRGPLTALGVVVPGVYDADNDRVLCQIMPELAAVRLNELVRTVLDLPATIGEDVQLAALAEVGDPYYVSQPLFYLYADTGVGGSYIDEGRLLMGANRMAGEIGQMLMAGGRRLEELVAWPVFLARLGLEAAETDADTLRLVRAALETGAPRALAAFQDITDTIATALCNMACLLNPRSIVVGGPYGDLGEPFIGAVRDRLLSRLIPEHAADLELLSARSGRHGMIRGAAVAALEEWLDGAFAGGDQE